MKTSLKKLLVGVAVLSAMILVGCKQVVPLATGYSVIGQINGRLVNDIGGPVANATITYNSPNTSLSNAKTVSTVTSDANGRFEISNLWTGSYTITASATDNLITTFSAEIPSLNSLGLTTEELKANYAYTTTLESDVVMPRRTGTLTGAFSTDPQSSDTYKLVMDLSTMDTSNYSYYASDATQSVSTTADKNGDFSFAKLPMTTYGGTSGSNPNGVYNPIKVYSATTGDYLTTLSLPSTPFALGKDGNAASYKMNRLATNYSAMAIVNPTAGTTKLTSVTAPIVLTFNNPISATRLVQDGEGDYVFAYLSLSGVKQKATVAISGKTLTITPTNSLLYGKTYTVTYNVSDGVTSSTGAQSLAFATGPSLTAPAKLTDLKINTDTSTPYGVASSAFNSDEDYFPVTFTYNDDYNYVGSYSVTTVDGTQKVGTTSLYNPVYTGNGNPAYAYIYVPAGSWNSGDKLYLKLVASYVDTVSNNTLSTDSNILSITDTVKPSYVRTLGSSYGTSYYSNPYYYWTVGTGNVITGGAAIDVCPTPKTTALGASLALTSTGTSDGLYYFTVDLGGTEYIDTDKLKLSGLSGLSYKVAYPDTVNKYTVTTATVILTLKAGSGTYAYKNQTFSLDIYDLAGNQYTSGLITATLKDSNYMNYPGSYTYDTTASRGYLPY